MTGDNKMENKRTTDNTFKYGNIDTQKDAQVMNFFQEKVNKPVLEIKMIPNPKFSVLKFIGQDNY